MMKPSKASGQSSSRSTKSVKSSKSSPPPTPPDDARFVPEQYSQMPHFQPPPYQGDSVLQRLETKESRMHQLTALLETMKEETAGTTHAMERTLQENTHLQHMNHQLTLDLQHAVSAADAQKAEHEKQLQEVMQVFTDERRDLQKKFEVYIESRQTEFDAARAAHDAEVARLTQDATDLHEKSRQLQAERDSCQDELGAAHDQLTVVQRDLALEKEHHDAAVAALTASMHQVDAEKHELGKLLADAFQDLERCRAALGEANTNVSRLTASLAQNDQSWTNTLSSFEKQILESNAQQHQVKDALRAAEHALQVERSQKEELNAAMRSELQRYTDELHEMQANHANAVALVVAERDECQDRLSQAKDRHQATEKRLNAVTKQFEDALAEAKQTLHAKTAEAEKAHVAADLTLADLNAQCIAIAQELDAAKLARQDTDARCAPLLAGCVNLTALLQLDSSSTMEDIVSKVGSVIAASNERQTLLEALQAKEEHLVMESQAAAAQLAQTQQSLETATAELDAVKQDCAALVVEIQTLAAKHDNDMSAVHASSQRLVEDAEAQKQAFAVTSMQLQRSVDKQRERIDQLEGEKRELLQEAEALNNELEVAYQAKTAIQMEVDEVKHRLAVLQSDHNDLQDAHGQLTAATSTDMAQLQARLADADDSLQRERAQMDDQTRSLMTTISTLEGQTASLNELVLQARADADASRAHAAELADTLERTRVELIDVQDLCAEWKEKADALTASSTSLESTLKADMAASANQCVALAADKRRLEGTVASLETVNGQMNAELHALRQEKQVANKHLEERDDELLAVQGELGQAKAELERVARSKQTLQTELSRAAEDLNDSLRQLEVLRREFRSQEKAHAAAQESFQKDMDALRHEHSEAIALNDELQAKISTIQSAANATINDLVGELTHAEDALKAEQATRAKDDELLRSQCRYIEEDLKRKEIEWKDATTMLKRELAVRRDNLDSVEAKYHKQKEVLEAKKAEVDKLTRENDQRQMKLAEMERKLAPLANIKETTATRLSEMKLICDAKLKDSHDLEERLRDEIVRLQKDKRDLEASHLRAKDDLDSSATGRFALVHQQLTSENKLVKSTLERTKQELQHATENVAALAQRLDVQQRAANATIADLSSRLQASDQQFQSALQAMARDLAMEKDRTSECVAQKNQLLKQLRKLQRPGSSEDYQQLQQLHPNIATSRSSIFQPEVSAEYGGSLLPPPKTHRSTGDLSGYEDLASIPVALLRAQIGLDMCSFDKSPASNQQADGGGTAPVPSLNLDHLNHSRSAPTSSLDLTGRIESGGDDGSSSKAKTKAAAKAKDAASLKLIKKKMSSKHGDDASFKFKTTESLPKLG